MDHLARKRSVFINYNIKRMNELIRHLSPPKRKLFKRIPFLLHVNSSDFPGYVDHPSCPYGIFGFHESGFWKLSLKHSGLDEKEIKPYLSKKYHILGLYLMGSSGTLAQSQRSDFDYWVLIDQSACTGEEMGFLTQKLEKIKTWSRATYSHDVNFFILDVNDIKKNHYKALDGESSGTAQKTILKEEFYRTFILMAGLIPFWAVTPPGIDDEIYNTVIALYALHEQSDKMEKNYIDLGNLTRVRKSECPGAILWQLYKSHFDPAKALIKACLIAYFNFLPEEAPLPCDLIKNKFAETIFGGSLYDPYVIIFDKVTAFLDSREWYELADTVRECIYLRLIGYLSPPENESASSKEVLLETYTNRWFWDEEKKSKFETYGAWSEAEKGHYDDLVVNKISTLYQHVSHDVRRASGKMDMSVSDFKGIRNRIAKYFRKDTGKLPRCSSYLSAKSPRLSLTVTFHLLGGGKRVWEVLDGTACKKDSDDPLYQAERFIEALAWIIANGLYNGDPEQIIFQQKVGSISSKHMRRLFMGIQQFMPGMNPEDIDFLKPPAPFRMIVVIHLDSHYDLNSFHEALCIVLNTWGEFFFHVKALSHIETLDNKCYELAQFIMDFRNRSSKTSFDHKIVLDTNIQGPNGIEERTEHFIKTRSRSHKEPFDKASQTNGSADQNESFILDL